MYKRARRGQTTEVRPRLVHIYRFVLRAFDPPCAEFEMACTKGTYVRKVAADLGEVLGCGAHLSRLRRTRSGEFSVEDAVTMKELVELGTEQLASRMIPINRFSPRAGVPGAR